MKTLINKLLVFGFMAVLVASSCKKDENKAVMPSDSTPGKLNASATALTLTKANETQDAVTFSFTNPDYGFQAAVTNTLQLAVAGTNFSAPKEVSLAAKVNTLTYTVLDFNALLLALNLPFDSTTDIEVRMQSVIGTNLAPKYSNVVNMTVQPYPLISWVYVPGNYQGWNPATADSLISATGNGIYKGIIYFPANGANNYEFKITPAKNWNLAYGDGGGGTISTSGGNLNAPGPGSYEITLNLNTNAWEINKNSWAVIGSATPNGWNDPDTDMVYNNTTKTWSVTIALVPGAFKFRYNDGWGTNLGGSNGNLTASGADINVSEAGNYRIVLDVNASTYTITKL